MAYVSARAAGCVVPPAIQVASLVAQGFSYANTGKGVTDHGISMVAEKDCAVHRVVKGEEICRENEGDGTATAFAPSGEEEGLGRYWRASANARQDQTGFGLLSAGLGVTYEDECFILTAAFERSRGHPT